MGEKAKAKIAKNKKRKTSAIFFTVPAGYKNRLERFLFGSKRPRIVGVKRQEVEIVGALVRRDKSGRFQPAVEFKTYEYEVVIRGGKKKARAFAELLVKKKFVPRDGVHISRKSQVLGLLDILNRNRR